MARLRPMFMIPLIWPAARRFIHHRNRNKRPMGRTQARTPARMFELGVVKVVLTFLSDRSFTSSGSARLWGGAVDVNFLPAGSR